VRWQPVPITGPAFEHHTSTAVWICQNKNAIIAIPAAALRWGTERPIVTTPLYGLKSVMSFISTRSLDNEPQGL
jgi:hypothetical protein